MRPRQTFRAFRDRNYRLLWPANFVAGTSFTTQTTLLAWLVLELTDSPWYVALVGFFRVAPLFFLGLLGGVLADSVNRRTLLVLTQCLNLSASVVMASLLFGGTTRFWHAYVVILVVGVGSALDLPSRRSIIHDLLGRSGVTNAVALDTLGMSAGFMLGPALAGFLIAHAGFTGGYVAVALLYCLSVALVWNLRLPRTRPAQRVKKAVAADIVQGLRYVAGHRALLPTVLVTLLFNVLPAPAAHLVPVIARDVLHVGVGLMGLLQSTAGLGSLTVVLLIASAANVSHHGRLYMGGVMVALLALLLFSFSRWYALSIPALLVYGLGMGVFTTMQPTLVMLLARADMRGKALGVITLAIGVGPVGALFIGGVAESAGPSFAIGLNAAIGLVCLVFIAALLPSLWRRAWTAAE